MRFDIQQTPELVSHIMTSYAGESDGHQAIRRDLGNFLWNNLNYRDALTLDDGAVERLCMPDCVNFVYDKRSGLVFFNVSPGTHNLLMAHFAALASTDFAANCDDWYHEKFIKPFDATSKLADAFILDGHGLFHSSVGDKKKVMVADDFKWSETEFQAFRFYKKYCPL